MTRENALTRPMWIAGLALVLALALSAAACSSADGDDRAEADHRPGTTASDDAAVDGTELAPCEEIAADETVGDNRPTPFPEPITSGDAQAATDVDVSETPAEPPVIDDDTDPDTETATETDAPQAAVGVTESALCATLQIGRDAVADGAHQLAASQRDLLIERRSGLADEELAAILADLDADTPLDPAIAEAGLRRCQTLGYEI